MFEDGHSMRCVRQFFRDSPYPEAETGDYGDLRSLITVEQRLGRPPFPAVPLVPQNDR